MVRLLREYLQCHLDCSAGIAVSCLHGIPIMQPMTAGTSMIFRQKRHSHSSKYRSFATGTFCPRFRRPGHWSMAAQKLLPLLLYLIHPLHQSLLSLAYKSCRRHLLVLRHDVGLSKAQLYRRLPFQPASHLKNYVQPFRALKT